jgi:hypothetical protein
MRPLALTSPEMRGPDVRALQHILNDRLAHYHSRTQLKPDGVYGRETAHAVSGVAYAMGLEHFDGSKGVLRIIEHPALREPVQLAREYHRRQERAAHHGGNLDAIVKNALHYVGTAERPPESNWGEPYPAEWEKHFGFESGVSWCGCFSGSMVLLAGGHVTSRVAFCPYIEADARSRTNGFDLWVPNHGEGVEPGWLVLYNWNGGSEPEHVGVVKEIHPDHLIAVEGNTGGTNPSDGGMVAIESRTYNFVVGYARPRL